MLFKISDTQQRMKDAMEQSVTQTGEKHQSIQNVPEGPQTYLKNILKQQLIYSMIKSSIRNLTKRNKNNSLPKDGHLL